ncbi:MAG: nuclear transport factor 2 family protein [Halobacteriales archaeon]|nr:nuclear transport factor 2 family protein [Halobacteriales archaeon]
MAATTHRSSAEIVRNAYEAFAEGDMEACAALMAPEVEWFEPEGSRYAGTYTGFEAILEHVFEPSMEDIVGMEVHPDQFIDCGETVVVLGNFEGMGPESGDHFSIPFAHVCACEDGQITEFRNYTDTAAWRDLYPR